MGTDTIIFLIFVLVFVFGGAIKKFIERLNEQGQAGRRPRADFEATPDELAEFLRGLSAARRPAARAEARPAAPDRFWEALPAEPEPETLRTALMAAPAATAPAARPRPAEPRRRRRPAASRRARPAESGRPTAEAVPAEAAKAAAAFPLALRGMGLRNAVVWSEVLGPPVALRQRRGRRPAARG